MSITEAIYFEKSILAIPITPEQYVLSEKLYQQNAAFKLNYHDLTYDQLMYAIHNLLGDNYQQSVKTLKSQLMQNLEKISPLEKALNAIEITLQTNGLNHLKPHSHHLNFWNSILLDVMFILILGLLTVLVIPFLVTSCILKRSYQNQNKLNLLNQQSHRYHCKVNEFLKTSTTTTPLRTCENVKHRHENQENEDSLTCRPRRRSLNSDVQKRRKRLSSNSSSSCNSSVSSSSAPTTPLSKKESSLFDQVSGDTDKNI